MAAAPPLVLCAAHTLPQRSWAEWTPTPRPVTTMMPAHTLPPTLSSLPRPHGVLIEAGTLAWFTAHSVTTSDSKSVTE